MKLDSTAFIRFMMCLGFVGCDSKTGSSSPSISPSIPITKNPAEIIGKGEQILPPGPTLTESVHTLISSTHPLEELLSFAYQQEVGSPRINAIFESINDADPFLALAFSLKFFQGDARPIKCNQAFEKLVKKDWGKSLVVLDTLPVGQCREFAVQSLARTVDTAEKMNAISSQISNFLPEEQDRFVSSLAPKAFNLIQDLSKSPMLNALAPSARCNFAQAWAAANSGRGDAEYLELRNSIPKEVLTFADTGFYDGLSNSTPERAVQLALSSSNPLWRGENIKKPAAVMGMRNPQQGFEFFQSVTQNEVRQMGIEAVMEQWLVTDPISASEFANKLQVGPDLNTVAVLISRFSVAKGDKEAAEAWKHKIQVNTAPLK